MKKPKFTKVISFLLAFAIVLSSVAVVVSAYSTVSTTYGCPQTLCIKKLNISGPYGDPNETVDSNVPFLNGKTYANVFTTQYWNNTEKLNEYHMYIIYCPKYDNSDGSLLRHTMTLMFAHHGYTTKSYTIYNESYHYANKKCDHGTDFRGSNVYALSQALCGEKSYLNEETMVNLADEYQAQNGCGKEAAILEPHTWTYSDWSNDESSKHTRTKTCTDCGYVVIESQSHSITTGAWQRSTTIQHKRTLTCSVCYYSKIEAADHQYIYSEWTNHSDVQHKRTATCTDCGYSKIEYGTHDKIKSEGIYYGSDEPNYSTYSGTKYHRYDYTCSSCDYTGSEYELHDMYVKTPWYDASETRHKQITQCYHCQFSVATNSPHTYPENLYTYESVDDTAHQITKHCDTCDRAVDGGIVNHNYVVGEWYKYSTANPYDDEYDHTKYHQRESVCSDCGNVKIEHAEHDWYWVTESWNYSSEERHTRTKRCKDCDYGWGYTDYHHFTTDTYYEQYSEDEHTKINPCDECEYEKETLEAHSFTASTVYTQFSESQHQVTQSCVCGEKHFSYADHVDQNSDCYCDKCGYLMTRFSVIVPTTMVLTMGTDGKVYSPSDVVIVNNSTAAVSVTKADISARNGWNIVPYSTNMANEKVDSKKIGFKMNDVQTVSSGTTDSLLYNNVWTIEKNKSSAVVYDAVVSATSSPVDEQVIEIVFVVDWKE